MLDGASVPSRVSSSVCVPSPQHAEHSVDCVHSGAQQRLESFANWIESNFMLVSNVEIKDDSSEDNSCPSVPMSHKFPLADAEAYSGGVPGSFQGALAEQLKSASLILSSAMSNPFPTNFPPIQTKEWCWSP